MAEENSKNTSAMDAVMAKLSRSEGESSGAANSLENTVSIEFEKTNKVLQDLKNIAINGVKNSAAFFAETKNAFSDVISSINNLKETFNNSDEPEISEKIEEVAEGAEEQRETNAMLDQIVQEVVGIHLLAQEALGMQADAARAALESSREGSGLPDAAEAAADPGDTDTGGMGWKGWLGTILLALGGAMVAWLTGAFDEFLPTEGILGDVFEFLNQFRGVFITLLAGAGPIIAGISSWIPTLLGTVGKIVGKIFFPIYLAINAVIGAVRGYLGEDGGTVSAAISGAFAQIISSLSFGLLSFDAVQEFIQPFFDNITAFFSDMIGIWGSESLSFGDKIMMSFERYWEYLSDQMGYFVDNVWPLISDLLVWLGQSLAAVGASIGEWIYRNIAEPIYLLFLMYIRKPLAQIMDAIKNKVYDVVEFALKALGDVALGILDYIPDWLTPEGLQRAARELTKIEIARSNGAANVEKEIEAVASSMVEYEQQQAREKRERLRKFDEEKKKREEAERKAAEEKEKKKLERQKKEEEKQKQREEAQRLQDERMAALTEQAHEDATERAELNTEHEKDRLEERKRELGVLDSVALAMGKLGMDIDSAKLDAVMKSSQEQVTSTLTGNLGVVAGGDLANLQAEKTRLEGADSPTVILNAPTNAVSTGGGAAVIAPHPTRDDRPVISRILSQQHIA